MMNHAKLVDKIDGGYIEISMATLAHEYSIIDYASKTMERNFFWNIRLGQGFHGCDIVAASPSLGNFVFIWGKREKLSMGCFFWHWGKITSSNSGWLFLTCKTCNCEFRELIKSTLKFSNKSLISSLISRVLVVDLERKEENSLEFLSALDIPLEYLMHKSQTSSYDRWKMSNFPIKFKISKISSLIPLRMSVFKISFSKWLCFDFLRLYLNHSKLSSKISYSPCIILKIYSLALQ